MAKRIATMARKRRMGMVIDLNRCIGCQGCAVSCKIKNNLPEGEWWNRVLTIGGDAIDVVAGGPDHPTIAFLPLACQHCAEPACLPVCPTGATYQREDGIVGIHSEDCIGCRSCIQACPYGVRVFNVREPVRPTEHALGSSAVTSGVRGTVEKCDFCMDRIDAGALPICIESCPARARFVGDLNDPDSEVARLIREAGAVQLQPEMGTDPSVYYIPVQNRMPRQTGMDFIAEEPTTYAQRPLEIMLNR
jgi:molybdopterin-containing oxidoreductase family iron-sulfur binding subunit